MKTTLQGVLHGKTIELVEAPNVPEGILVNVTIETDHSTSPTSAEARAALVRAGGAWADEGPELDEYLEWSRQQRKIERPEFEP